MNSDANIEFLFRLKTYNRTSTFYKSVACVKEEEFFPKFYNEMRIF